MSTPSSSNPAPDWPVITNEVGEVDVEETKKRARKIAARMDGVVPIITGFLAEDHDGNVTTLGRGGSDTTAVMLGNYMDADEVVIVTDVEGVMTGDPRVVEGARVVGSSRRRATEPLVPRRGGRRAVRALVQGRGPRSQSRPLPARRPAQRRYPD